MRGMYAMVRRKVTDIHFYQVDDSWSACAYHVNYNGAKEYIVTNIEAKTFEKAVEAVQRELHEMRP